MKYDRDVETPVIKDAWNKYPQNDSDMWKEIIDLAFEKGGLLIEGRAGTGKSYIPKSAMGRTDFTIPYKLLPEKVRCMSFTNKASRGICGTTIHKSFKLNYSMKTQYKTIKSLCKYDVVVLDEIGMICNGLWNILKLLKLAKPQIVFILMGDWRQLPPVEPGRIVDVDIFNHPVVKFLTKCNKIELTIRKRYDKELWDFLERGFNDDDWSGLEERQVSYDECYENKHIVFFNKTRDIINDMCMEYFKDECEYSYYLPYERKDDDDKAKSVYIYDGLPVMSYKNNSKLGIVNSEEFIVNSWDENKTTFMREEGGENVEIETDKFHDFFVCNYASTAHKSQGATYTNKVFLWDFKHMVKNKHIAYTACSRETKLENIVVSKGFI
jgi:ATP-dependent exoDNAse (exonuclease V) alpha subunit